MTKTLYWLDWRRPGRPFEFHPGDGRDLYPTEEQAIQARKYIHTEKVFLELKAVGLVSEESVAEAPIYRLTVTVHEGVVTP